MWILPIIFLAVFIQTDCETVKVEETPIKAFLNDVETGSMIDDLFKKFLEQLKDVLKNGSKFFGIPPLDPYKSGPVNESLNLEDMKGNMSAASTTLSDLSNYDVTNAEIKGLLIRMGFHWSEIEGNMTAYNITNGRFMNFVNVFGNGDAVFTLKDLKFSTQITLKLKNVHNISIKTMESQISLGGFKFYTEGLYNNSFVSQEMSVVISEMGPEFIETYQKELTEEINKRIMDIVNKFLSYLALNDLVNIIFGKSP